MLLIKQLRRAGRRLFLFGCFVLSLMFLNAAAVYAGALSEATGTGGDIFRLEPYKPLYFIGALDRTLDTQDPTLQEEEVQFQLSFKVPVSDIPFWNGKAAIGYTQISYWQMFNTDYSSPFRETNYAPELMASFERDTSILGLERIRTVVSFIHESNGRGGLESRSWNRLYAEAKFDWKQITIGLKPWYRIPESAKKSSTDARGDDNPDIIRFLGYGELTVVYRDNAFSILITGRDNLRSHGTNRGSLRLDLAFPIRNDVYFYVQVFDGYGESLIDYNRYSSRIGAGFMVGRFQ
jgi:phospholipase A1